MAEPVALGIKPPAQMTLGDMVNIARGAQAYQQAEQANPLALEKARIEIQRAGQEARTGQINLGVAEQTDLERKNIQTFMSNPKNWQNETGDVDINKINAEVTRLAPLTGRDQIEKLTTLAKSQTENTKAAQDLTQSERAIIAGPIGVLGRMGVKDKNVYLKELENTAKFHPDNKRLLRLIDAQKTLINQLPANADVASAGVRVSEGLLSPLEATTAFAPKAKLTDIGGQLVETTETPSVGNVAPRVAKTGVVSGKTLAPQVYTTETGAPGIIGGGGGGNVAPPANVLTPPINIAPPTANAPLGAPKVAPSATPVGQQLGEQFGARGSLQRSPDETYDAYKARVADLAAKPKQANLALSLANNDSIPNQEFTNNKVLGLLESKNIRVGKLAEAIAKKTGGIGLNSEEVEIQKYLEQRIRQNALRSNQDEESQKMASGSFGTDINALRDIIYNDKGLLASQRLLNQGILKYQGNPNKPNLAAINDFENKFNLLNQDRNVTHLLGIVGDRALEELSKSDVQQLKKTFGGMSKDQMDKLFEKKQALEDLVRGGK
jgi:hypothetical protein